MNKWKVIRNCTTAELGSQYCIWNKRNLVSLLTGDESWVYHAADSERMWLLEGTIPHFHPGTIISTLQVVISIFWHSVIAPLPPTTKLAIAQFGSDIIRKIAEGLSFDLATPIRQLLLHMHKVTPTKPENRSNF
jgi:hypothetical protein